ncbi:MAG: hypothetical protein K8R57_02845 [Verrucomicrobia bacterium]|nr:hypothetical protein [Verrucomicrobiota bacterium]
MPQATIKLQPAPAAAARKIGESTPSVTSSIATTSTTPAKISGKAVGDVPKNLNLNKSPDEIEKETASSSELPLPLLISVAALALVAFGIQLWTFLLS